MEIMGYDDAPSPEGLSVAIGNFDGVHRGHRAVIDAARAAAERLGAPLGVVTFEPHPREVFRPDDPPFRLTTAAGKARRLAALGVNRLISLPFDARIHKLTAERFCAEILRDRVNAVHVAVGDDFRFGAGRDGDAAALTALGARLGFETRIVRPVGGEEAVYSSSAVRRALREGRPEEAAAILGDWHRIEGPVRHGDKRGRTLGYPTANQSLDGVMHPAYGVYAVRAEVLDGPHRGVYDGVASLGLRPTFDKKVANFETFLFDFEGDIYDAELSVMLCAYLRPELKFEGLDALIEQMDADSAQAREILARLAQG